MGYDLHITRHPDPDCDSIDTDKPNGVISLQEWRNYVDGDPSMRMDDYAEAILPGGKSLRVTEPGIAVWLDHPTATRESGLAWLHFSNGQILVKHPDQESLGKMLSIASALDAVVIGDDGEQYMNPTSHGIAPAADRTSEPHPTPWWRFW